jgi:hypothetical protein
MQKAEEIILKKKNMLRGIYVGGYETQPFQ